MDDKATQSSGRAAVASGPQTDPQTTRYSQESVPPAINVPPPPPSPEPTRRDPSIPTLASTSKPTNLGDHHHEKEDIPCLTRFAKFIYNKPKKTICERSLRDWPKIIGYAIIYLMFLATWTMILLYIALNILKSTLNSRHGIAFESLVYEANYIGLTAVPLSVHNYPIIWYRRGQMEDYELYMNSLDNLLAKKRVKRQTSDLGPCGQRPYGYGDKPCVVVKLNKQWLWQARPVQQNSTNFQQLPSAVKNWMKINSMMYWLHCKGFNNYDKEHIGNIKYYPNPPGYDSRLFPLDANRSSPLVAIQFSNFTVGISLAVECTLWYENGHSDLSFVLYVSPERERAETNDGNRSTFSHL